MCGDFNHEDTEIGVKALKLITGLKDAWRTATKRVKNFLGSSVAWDFEIGGGKWLKETFATSQHEDCHETSNKLIRSSEYSNSDNSKNLSEPTQILSF